jgi:IclR family pca regulon transcriptional regulator
MLVLRQQSLSAAEYAGPGGSSAGLDWPDGTGICGPSCPFSVIEAWAERFSVTLRGAAAEAKLSLCEARLLEDNSVSAKEDPEFVQSLARGLAVLQSFESDKPAMTLSEVAKRTGLSRGTSRRLLLTLERLGFVASDGKLFSLRPRVMDLGYRYLSSLPWWHVAQPILEEAVAATGESFNIAILDGTDIVYITGIAINRIVTTAIRIGTRLPALATASGRVLLGRMPDAQLDDYLAAATPTRYTPKTIVDRAELAVDETVALCPTTTDDRGELEIELRSIAVVIEDRGGRAIGALATSSHSYREPARNSIRRNLPVLRETATKITAAAPA